VFGIKIDHLGDERSVTAVSPVDVKEGVPEDRSRSTIEITYTS